MCDQRYAGPGPRASPRYGAPPVPSARRRLRDLGHVVGCFPPGPRNALVDVPEVLVGHETLISDGPADLAVRTGVTAVLPHGGNLHAEKVLGGAHIINAYGKAAGLTQLAELGTIESPILVTSTLSVGAAWEGGLRHLLEQNPEAGRDRDTVNVIVGDVFDGWLSDARGLHVRPDDAVAAIRAARRDEVAEGSVGAGTGTSCLGFKAGVGTASRVGLAEPRHTLGGLVVTNYGGRRDLRLLEGAAPAAVEALLDRAPVAPGAGEGGSVVVILGTDAPLSERQLRRLAARATFGLARAGGYAPHPSGDYVLAFSTAHRIPHHADATHDSFRFLRDDGASMRELFQMAGEVTQEAVLNSLCMAGPMVGRDGHRREALPYEVLAGLPRA